MDIGVIGLSAAGRNLVLNIAERGFGVVGFDNDPCRVAVLRDEVASRPIRCADTLADLVQELSVPRTVLLLVPPGASVDAAIGELLWLLSQGDLIIDGGNSHFHDTENRFNMLRERGLDYLGVGILGGAEGARHGPCLVPGGPRDAYERVRGLFEAVAARVNGEPCVAWCGRGSAGHYVRMVHNGIESALLQLMSEAYDLLHRGMEMTNDELFDVFEAWNSTELKSFLMEITAGILRQYDLDTDSLLVPSAADEAWQKGAATWTSQEATALNVPVPTIDIAVAMRHLSAIKSERQGPPRFLQNSTIRYHGRHEAGPRELRNALYASMIITCAQGMALLRRASEAYRYELNLADITRIWRGGSSIRAALLEKILAAFQARSDLPNLLLDVDLARELEQRQNDLRLVVCEAAEQGIPAPALMASLAYWDAYRSEWLPANLIRTQRGVLNGSIATRA